MPLHNRWITQVPMIWMTHFTKNNHNKSDQNNQQPSFNDMSCNVFTSIFEATLCPEKCQNLSIFFYHML